MRLFFALLLFCMTLSSAHATQVNCPKKLSFHGEAALVIKATDMLKSIYKKLGCDIELAFLPTKRSLSEFNHGRVDGEFFRFPEIEKHYTRPFMRSGIPFMQLELGIWQHPDENIAKSKPLGYVRGFPWHDQFAREHGEIRMIGYVNLDGLNAAYNKGIVGSMLTNTLYANYISEHGIVTTPIVRQKVIKSRPFYHYLSLEYAGFMKKFNQALSEDNPFLALNK